MKSPIQYYIAIVLFNLISVTSVYSIEWNGAKPVVEKMLSYYKANPNYSTIIADEWIKVDGNRESIGDTIFAHKYNDYGYIRNGERIQVFTEQFDIYINEKEKTMNVREISKEELVEISKMIPNMETIIEYFELCDSSRIITFNASVYTIDFYFNHPLMNRTRMLIDDQGRIKEIYRYYIQVEEYVAQHTVFVLMQPLMNANIEEFKQGNYIQVVKKKKETEVTVSDKYKNYDFRLIKF